MGKTAVFVLSVLQRVDPNVKGQVLCLVLCHARELAFQIQQEFDRFKKYITPPVSTRVIYGGTPVSTDRSDMQNNPPHILIGTPGRVQHLVKEGALKLDFVKYFILDECDQLLDSLDMRRDVQNIFKATPHNKQVMMFSATLSDPVREVCKKFMHNPREIYINDHGKLPLDELKQYYARLNEDEKNRKLINLLDSISFNQVIIFVKSAERAEVLNGLLVKENFPSICTFGGMDQAERIKRYQVFKKFEARIMVATSLYGRGVDFERVNVVINYDMPADEDTYLHRIGRAGRFGTKGIAISFISSADDKLLLDKVLQKFVVPIPELPESIDPSLYMTSTS